MSRTEEVKAEFQEKLAKAEREDKITAALPVEATFICCHPDCASVKYQGTYLNQLSINDAASIYRKYRDAGLIVPAEHWKGGCCSVRPHDINSTEKDQGSVMDGESWAELALHTAGSRGEVQSHELIFWAKLNGEYLQVHIEIQADWKWLPEVQMSFNRSGDVSRFNLTPKFIGEDQRRKWWSSQPNYHLSYYWADVHNFESWLNNQMEKVIS